MPHPTQMIEVTLQVTTSDEAAAATVAEVMSRLLVGLSSEDVYTSLNVDRYEQTCHHDEAQP
jgi:hypothetical protein